MMMSNVCLIIPFDPVNLSGPTNAPYPPLRLAYLAAVTKAHGCKAAVIDGVGEGFGKTWTYHEKFFLHGLTIDGLLGRIPAACDIIGISMLYSNLYPPVAEFVRKLRMMKPHAKVYIGGEGVTGIADYIVSELPVDAAVIGEGEWPWVQLLSAVGTDIGGIPNVVTRTRSSKEARRPGEKGCYGDPDEIPFPDWGGIPLEKYWTGSSHGVGPFEDAKFLPVTASRGCPFKCRFCTAPGTWGTQRYRKPQNVVEEIRSFSEKYGVRQFTFHDLSLTTDPAWLNSFLDALLSSGLSIRWYSPGGFRAQRLSRDTLERLKRSGLTQLNIAPETGSKRVMEWIDKKITAESVMETVTNAKAAGLRVQAYFIVGYPVESAEDFLDTMKFLSKLAVAGVDEGVVSAFSLLPGSPHFETVMERGGFRPDEEYFAALFHGRLGLRVSYSPYFNGPEVQLLRLYALFWFYLRSFIRHPKKSLPLLRAVLTGRGGTMLSRVAGQGFLNILRSAAPVFSLRSAALLFSLFRRIRVKARFP